MASYWKSNPRYFCEICKCWLSGDKASIEFHERGKSHQQKKEKHITDLRKRSAEQYRNNEKAGQYLRQMEDAAVQAYKKDLAKQGLVYQDRGPMSSSRPSAGIHSYHFVDPPAGKKPPKRKQKDPIKPPAESSWTKQTSPEGQEYYWNSETGESRWTKPEGFIEDKGNSSNVDQHQKTPGDSKNGEKSSWIKQTSPEGQVYYWNTETAKSQWVKPDGFTETTEKVTDLPDPGKTQDQKAADSWTEGVSPDGHTYYWNKETGKSQWEKPKGFEAKTKVTPVDNTDKNSQESGVEPTKRPRRDPYGSWSVVREPKPKKQIDWQLPNKGPEPAKEGLVDRTALESFDEPEPPKFNEKIVTSLGGEGGSTVFKRKGTKQRSIRRRNDDD